MAKSEATQLAEALISWLNSQEVKRVDAEAAMIKVLAQFIVRQSTDVKVLHDLMDQHMAHLQLELSRRLRHVLGR